jgi:predicted DNA binding CopG/RHH family protein
MVGTTTRLTPAIPATEVMTRRILIHENANKNNDERRIRLFPIHPNPYTKNLKKQITIRLEEEVVNYFKTLSSKTGIPYQTLINLYLQDCAKSQRKPSLEWA